MLTVSHDHDPDPEPGALRQRTAAARRTTRRRFSPASPPRSPAGGLGWFASPARRCRSSRSPSPARRRTRSRSSPRRPRSASDNRWWPAWTRPRSPRPWWWSRRCRGRGREVVALDSQCPLAVTMRAAPNGRRQGRGRAAAPPGRRRGVCRRPRRTGGFRSSSPGPAPTAAGLRAATGAVTALAPHKAPEASLTVDGAWSDSVSARSPWGGDGSVRTSAAVAVVLLKTPRRPSSSTSPRPPRRSPAETPSATIHCAGSTFGSAPPHQPHPSL